MTPPRNARLAPGASVMRPPSSPPVQDSATATLRLSRSRRARSFAGSGPPEAKPWAVMRASAPTDPPRNQGTAGNRFPFRGSAGRSPASSVRLQPAQPAAGVPLDEEGGDGGRHGLAPGAVVGGQLRPDGL